MNVTEGSYMQGEYSTIQLKQNTQYRSECKKRWKNAEKKIKY